VRGEAVGALVGLGDAERDPLAVGATDRSVAQRAEEPEPASSTAERAIDVVMLGVAPSADLTTSSSSFA
jgi:hypothetical protein